jgi:hypothetical protein
MKTILLTFICILFLTAFRSFGQEHKTDNYSFFKLYVTNDKDEVLLVKWEGQWEIVGDRYNEPVSIREFGNKMAADMGIKITEPKLCGLFTQRWQGTPGATIMHYYRARYTSGNLKVPPDCTDIKWFSFDEAIKVIPYPIMTSMMIQMKKNPGKVIGAAFERYKDANNVSQHKVLEDFHILN